MWHEHLERLDPESTARRAAERWNAQPGSLRFVGRSANAVFRFERGSASYYLRILHAALRPEPEVAATIDYLRHLHAHGGQVCRPEPSASGRFVEPIAQGEEVFLATVVAAAPGEPLRAERCEPRALEAVGRSIASLHAAAESFAPADPSLFLRWTDHWRETGASIDSHDALAEQERERLDVWLATLVGRSAPDAFGLSHADCNLGNLIDDGRRVTIIDFDEPVFHYWAADVARPLRDFTKQDRERRRGVLSAIVAGYRSLRSLPEEWVAALPWLLRIKDFEIYAWARRPENRNVVLLPGGDSPAALVLELRARMQQPLEW